VSKLELSGETCTTRQAAEALGVALRTAQLWTESGRLRAWKTEGGHRRILVESVRELLNARDAWTHISPADTQPEQRRHDPVQGYPVAEIDVSAAEVEMKQQANGELQLLLRLNLRPA